jgi:archaemetzincin
MPRRPVLGLVPLGPVDPEILRYLRRAIARLLGLPVRILRPRPLPSQSYHPGRNQHHSTLLLEYLLDDSRGPLRVLGITAVDLHIPIFTFVFGEAQLDGKAAVVSIFRPRGDAGGVRPPKNLLFRRLLQLSLHELGHTFGLGHCRQPGCLMGFSANLEKLDQKNLALCEYCQIMLGDYLKEQGLLPRPRRQVETGAPGAPRPVWDGDRKGRR